MAEDTIIIKRVKKGGHGGHHGGAWKIAYADFVTAMMAFFLLLWLLNAVTEEQLSGIADYFTPTAASKSQSGSGGVMGGTTVATEGALEDIFSTPQVMEDLPPPKAGSGGDFLQDAPTQETPEDQMTPEQAQQQQQQQQEQQQFDNAAEMLRQAIETNPSFQQLAESLMIEDTSEGLRIQIVDQDGLAMFASGRATLYEHTERVLALVATAIQTTPQNIAISGHTDAVPFSSRDHTYTNWELSADRANSARRFLLQQGVPENRLSEVVGRADTQPLLPDDPTNARNRRLSIVLLRGTGEQPPPEPEKPYAPDILAK